MWEHELFSLERDIQQRSDAKSAEDPMSLPVVVVLQSLTLLFCIGV
jgi:hypothetical protein